MAAKNLSTFEHLFKELFRPLSGFAMKYTGDLEEAKSLVHDVFVGLWEKLDTLPGDTNYRSYLYTGVRNRGLNYIRDRKKQVAFENVPEEKLAEDHDRLVTEEMEREIEIAIQTLPEKCREVFELNRKEGLKYAQIADQLGISIKTVEAQMSKALSVLRERLGEFLSLIFLFMG